MFDPDRALADMASQVRACRSMDRLTLQQLATRSGVAASTIHKIEAQQMIPTVSVLLKIAKGLGRRPDELVRDPTSYATQEDRGPGATGSESGQATCRPIDLGVWRVELTAGQPLSPIELGPSQRAIVLVEHGALRLLVDGQPVEMAVGDCIELEGGRLEGPEGCTMDTWLTLLVSPPGRLIAHLGRPRLSSPAPR